MNKKRILRIILLIIVFFGVSYFIFDIIDFKSVLEKIGIFKYLLIPLISIFGNNSFTASILYPILFFLKEIGTNIFLLIILAALGGIIGDLIFVFFGKKINENMTKKPNKKVLEFFKRKQNSPYLSLFIFIYAAFFPMPNEIMTFALGYLKYHIKNFLIPLALGNLFYFSILIYVGGSIWELVF